MLLMTSIILFIACDELDVLSEMLLRLLGKYDPDSTYN